MAKIAFDLQVDEDKLLDDPERPVTLANALKGFSEANGYTPMELMLAVGLIQAQFLDLFHMVAMQPNVASYVKNSITIEKE